MDDAFLAVEDATKQFADKGEYIPTGSKDVFIKTTSPLLRGKELSGASSSVASRSQSPKTVKTASDSHLANNLALVANLLGDDEVLLRKGVLDVQFGRARPRGDEEESSLTPLYVPFGPHFGWGPRGRKEQLRYQNYRSLRPTKSSYGRNLERQCGFYSVQRLAYKTKGQKDEDLADLLFPKIDAGKDLRPQQLREEAFFDAVEEVEEDEEDHPTPEPVVDTAVLDVVLDIVFEAMRSHPSWFNYELFLSRCKLVLGSFLDHVIKSEVEDVTTLPRWAYYLALLRLTLWPKMETPPPVRNEEAAQKKAFRDLTRLLPDPALDVLGKEELFCALDAILNSVSGANLNLHFIFTALEIVLQDLFPEVDFLAQLALKLEKK